MKKNADGFICEIQDEISTIQSNTSRIQFDISDFGFEREETGSLEDIKRLESELKDLGTWIKLGLVPEKDLKKHAEEMDNLKGKIDRYKERLVKLNPEKPTSI